MKKTMAYIVTVLLLLSCVACQKEPPEDEGKENPEGYLFSIPGDESFLQMKSLGDGFALLSRYEGKWIVSYANTEIMLLTETLLTLQARNEKTPVFHTFSDSGEFGFIYLDHRLFFVSMHTAQYAEYTLPADVDLSTALYHGGEFYYTVGEYILCSGYDFSSYSVLNTGKIENFGGLAALDNKTQTLFFATKDDTGFTGISSLLRGTPEITPVLKIAFDTFMPLQDGYVILIRNQKDGKTYIRLNCVTGETNELYVSLKRNYRAVDISGNGAYLIGVSYKDVNNTQTVVDVYDMVSQSVIQRYNMVYASLYNVIAMSNNGRYILYCRNTLDGRVVCYLDLKEVISNRI
ncbi:MAG TPA: hypothetical protein DCY74_02790 [Clostridiales bacterium]|jgi:hypothetical protein|nr:hypothetical protein [Clostridiales bacterium]HCG35524.1 hypothetical protein [Clostridiales bacterium]